MDLFVLALAGEWQIYENASYYPSSVLGEVVFVALAYLFILAFTARCKAGMVLADLVVLRLLRLLSRGAVWAWRHLRVLVLSLPLTWKTAAVLVALMAAELLMLAYDLNEAELVVYLALHILILGAAMWQVLALRKLQQGGENLAKGDFSHPITLSRGALPELKRHAANLNSVQQGIQQAVEEKMKSERLKTQLITNVSHDIKTPLTSISGYAEIIREGMVRSEDVSRFAGKIYEEAQRLMREGRISAIVHIPAFFEKNILSNSQTHIECSVSGTNITVNGLLSKDLQTAVTTFQAGVQLQLLMKQGLTEKQAMAQIMPVRFVKHVLFNPYINYSYYLSPSFMPMMLMIFAMLVTIFAIGTELKAGTAREWLDTAGGSVFAALVGKMLPLVVMMLLMTLMMFLILFKIVGVPLNGSLTALLFGCMLFVLAYMAIGVLIVTLLSNLRLSLSIGGGYSVLAFTFSGLTFPMMAMYPWVQAFSKIFPFTFYTDIFIDQALRGAPVVDSLWDMGYIALFIVLPMLCLPRLRKICSDEKYWGRM